jgi:hypothetical protein
MGETNPGEMIFVADNAEGLCMFESYPDGTFGFSGHNCGHHKWVPVSQREMVKLATWLAERLPPIPGVNVPGGM